jgi:hypothetical protein
MVFSKFLHLNGYVQCLVSTLEVVAGIALNKRDNAFHKKCAGQNRRHNHYLLKLPDFWYRTQQVKTMKKCNPLQHATKKKRGGGKKSSCCASVFLNGSVYSCALTA